jgi:selenocysteine lyase/cysteine desulfurase
MNHTPFALLEEGIRASLETYSNVHRGSGVFARVSEQLLEESRHIVLDYLGCPSDTWDAVLCSPRRAANLTRMLASGTWKSISSAELGLPLGITALAIQKSALPGGIPPETGGGTARLMGPDWVVWNRNADRFEAGTPPLVPIFALARALQIVKKQGTDCFRAAAENGPAAEDILYHDDCEAFRGMALLEHLRTVRIGRATQVPTLRGMQPFIYLDNGASHPTFEPVWKAVCDTWRLPESRTQEVVAAVRNITLRYLGAPAETFDAIFTTNATEAVNLAAASFEREFGQNDDNVILNTLLEHSSNELPWRNLPHASLVRLTVSEDGFISTELLEETLRAYNSDNKYGSKRIRLVAVSGGSNVLGTYNDLAAISQVVHQYGARLLVDAAQLVAHRPVQMEAWNIDYLVFSAHKTYAPFGTGVLVHRKGLLSFTPEETAAIRQSGEENAAGIAALGKALVLLERIGLDVVEAEEIHLTSLLIGGMAAIPGMRIYGIGNTEHSGFTRRGGVVVFALGNKLSETTAEELSRRAGIGIRWGCHCAHLLVKYLLHVPGLLEKFQHGLVQVFKKIRLPGLARISLGIENTEGEIAILLQTLTDMATGKKPDAAPGVTPKTVKEQTEVFIQKAVGRVFGV